VPHCTGLGKQTKNKDIHRILCPISNPEGRGGFLYFFLGIV
jgi:hypothetical protein